jgi:hypothetical protein
MTADILNSTARRFPATDMPVGLMLALVAAGLPRTVLADLGIVAPESSLLYYVLALAPFAAWVVVALVRGTRRPFLDFLVLGALYGLSLLIVHQVLWDVGPSLGHSPPESAVAFAAGFDPRLAGARAPRVHQRDRDDDRSRQRRGRRRGRLVRPGVAQAPRRPVRPLNPARSGRPAGAGPRARPRSRLRATSRYASRVPGRGRVTR